jgi:nucleoid-associated protein YgaU
MQVRTNVRSGWRYAVQPGDTLINLARRFYGNQDWQRIYNYRNNRWIIGPNPNYLRSGTVIELW